MQNDFLLSEVEVKKKINRLQLPGSVEYLGGYAHIPYRRLYNNRLIDEGVKQVPIPAVQYEADGSIDIAWLNGVINHPDFDNMEALTTWREHLQEQSESNA